MDIIDIPQPYYYDSKHNYTGLHTEDGDVLNVEIKEVHKRELWHMKNL